MSITLSNVGFEWPNGRTVFKDINVSLNHKIYGLVGANGVGKSTLAQLIAGNLTPTEGTLRSTERVRIFEQLVPRPEDLKLSGGEWAKKRLSEVVSSDATFLILDEPTNHLDREGRLEVQNIITRFKGGVLLISHDRELLSHAEDILELTTQGLSVHGGGWEQYLRARDAERERLFQNLEKAKRNRNKAERKRHELVERQQKRTRQGRIAGEKSNLPKIVRGALKRAAQKTQGKIDKATKTEVDQAVTEAWDAFQALKVDPVMYARLPKVQIAAGKTIAEAHDFNFQFHGKKAQLFPNPIDFHIRGPARVVIRGPNGSGKTTLFKALLGHPLPGTPTGSLRLGPVRAALLDQDYKVLDLNLSILENIRESIALPEGEIRSLLAMFLFPGDTVHQRAGTLSGGERMRASLAKILICDPPPEVIFLDEPTNNLDLANIEFLESLLNQYEGAIIVVSHDEEFLKALNITEEIILELDTRRKGPSVI